ncbi:MAG: hypothetical protein QOJ76_27, partial [Acidobacteriota bacterium]|nr:hypothetical protein [Acidobacteriota bacterium]
VEVAGKEDVRVIVHARRGAVLGGKVSYADGDPAVNVTVNLMRRGPDGRLAKYLSGANLVSLSELRTDDRGMFRITGLPPGEYFVGVSESVDHGDGGGGRGRSDDISGMVEGLMGQQLLMTFYPSANSPKDASVVKVEAGDERGDIDVTIPERELRTVAGVVRGRRDRQPVANARVTIFRKEDAATAMGREAVSLTSGELSQNATTTDADGHWQFREIPDGPYTVFVRPPEEYENVDVEATRDENTTSTNANVTIENMNRAIDGAPYPRRKKKGYAPARREVEVTGDVSEIEVEVSDGGHVSGTITVDGGRPPRYGYVNVLRVAEGTAEPDGMDTKSATAYGGRFSVEGLPAGKFFIQPSAYDEDGQLYVKSITWNGKNLLREPLEIGEGANADGIEIVYSRSPATLRVRTTREGGKGIAPNVNVFLMQADASDRTPYAQQLFCSSGSDGFCSINAPPGEYAVIAVPRSAARGSVVDELLRRLAAAPRVSLRAGETKAFEVSVPDK